MRQFSPTYHAVETLLDAGWSGTYGDLCVAVGRTRRSGRVIGRLVKGYAKRHSGWPHTRVVSQRTGRPAYEG
jgi:alkylated DNA nucleotide flippase Atl1